MTSQDKRSPAAEDIDLMTFGKYKGEPLMDVPASYLTWLWRDGVSQWSGQALSPRDPAWVEPKVRLANYIWNAQDAIAQETGETL